MHIRIVALLVCIWPALSFGQTAVSVEAEPHHKVVLKNDSVMVLRVKVSPGEATEYHTHLHDRFAVFLAESSSAWQVPGQPEHAPETHKPGDVSSAESKGPFTHRVRDVGTSAFEVLDIELLQRPALAPAPPSAAVAAENPSGRAYKWSLAPGETSLMHSHGRPYLIVAATPMTLKMTSPDGQSMTHEVQAGDFHWINSKVTHTLTNAGSASGSVIEIELK